MRRLPQTCGRVVSGLLAFLLASAVALLASTQPAAAHGTLATSTPASGATVREPLTSVRLLFTEKAAANAFFTITAPGGTRVDNGWSPGEPQPLEKPVREYFLVNGKFEPREYTTGFPAVVAVAHLPAKGQYSVSYLSVASDGDAVRGTLTFRYEGRVTAAPKGWSPPSTQPDPALVAAAEQHNTSGQASAVPTTADDPSTPPAAAAPETGSTDKSGPGALAWTGLALVAAVGAVAGFVVWRRRSASAGTPTGRGRTSAATSGRRGGGTRAPNRAGAGKTTGGKTVGGKAAGDRTGGGKTGAGKTGAGKTVGAQAGGGRTSGGTAGEVGAAAGVVARTASDRRRPATVPAARKGDTVVTARTGVTVEPTPTDQVEKPLASTDDEPAVDSGPRPDTDLAAATPGSRLSNTHLALLVGGLVLALLAGFGLARIGTGDETPAGRDARQPAGGPATAGQEGSATDGHQHSSGTGPHTHRGDDATGAALATGTTVSAGGYTLQPLERTQPPGVRADYRFRIVGTDRQPATRFAVVHDKPLHMIVVGRDLSGYQHLHPTMAPDGTWSVPLTLARPGGYRVYADFSVTATNGTQIPLVLGVDHTVPGAHTPTALPPVRAEATAGPYAVSMNGTPTVGVTAPMHFQVSADPTIPAQLERYLGAYGHLVVVREGDLGYVHVHPEQELVDGSVKFWLTAPSSGRYRAFFDFQIAGKVHTAEFTINVP
ncbi:copper resistance protein CopC [Micromonospora sp. NPDC049171]|uniref:copper resistance CopC family protein n=1 Tax=Micromonospora sp. NPDC049171 TaxID=3155770 RepID=UPI0033D9C532